MYINFKVVTNEMRRATTDDQLNKSVEILGRLFAQSHPSDPYIFDAFNKPILRTFDDLLNILASNSSFWAFNKIRK
jgi:hypothetical protein